MDMHAQVAGFVEEYLAASAIQQVCIQSLINETFTAAIKALLLK